MTQQHGLSRSSKRNSEAIAFARRQRASANEFAMDVWQMLRNRRCRGQKFRREYPIPPYTADFCCVALKLIIEIDGVHHQSEAGRNRDARRDSWLAEQGYDVLRISGFRVTQDPDEVKLQIEKAIDRRAQAMKRPSPPTPLPEAGRGE